MIILWARQTFYSKVLTLICLSPQISTCLNTTMLRDRGYCSENPAGCRSMTNLTREGFSLSFPQKCVCVRMLNPKVLNCSEHRSTALTWGGLVYGLGKLITVPFWWNVFLLRLHGKLIFCCCCCCFCSSNFEDLQKLCEQHEHFHPCENKSIDCAEIVSYHQDSSTDHTRQMHAIYKQLLV